MVCPSPHWGVGAALRGGRSFCTRAGMESAVFYAVGVQFWRNCRRHVGGYGSGWKYIFRRQKQTATGIFWIAHLHCPTPETALSAKQHPSAERPPSQRPAGAGHGVPCDIQPEGEPYACADRIKTPALGEVLSSLVPLRFYPSGSASARAYGSPSGVTLLPSPPLPATPIFSVNHQIIY